MYRVIWSPTWSGPSWTRVGALPTIGGASRRWSRLGNIWSASSAPAHLCNKNNQTTRTNRRRAERPRPLLIPQTWEEADREHHHHHRRLRRI